MEYILQKLVDLERYETGEHPLPTMPIVDSKTVQNADTAREKGYDAGKKKAVLKSTLLLMSWGFLMPLV